MRWLALITLLLTPLTARGDLPMEELPLRVEVWAGAESLAISLIGDFELQSTTDSPTPNQRAVEWDTVSTLASGESLTLSDLGEGISVNGDRSASYLHCRLVSDSPDAHVLISDVPYGRGWWWETSEDREYPSPVEFHLWTEVAPPSGHPGFFGDPDGGIQVVVEVPMEEYLRGVVPHEIGGDSHTEALKAQAIAARTETYFKLERTNHPHSNVDCCSEVHCMAYGGVGGTNTRCDEAIASTRGQVIVANGHLIDAVYASNCGGWSENIENSWPDRSDAGANQITPWLIGICDVPEPIDVDLTSEEDLRRWVDDPPTTAWCSADNPNVPEWSRRNWRWERTFTAQETEDMVAQRVEGLGRITAFEPLSRGVSGRLIELRVIGDEGEAVVGPELSIRRLFDPPLRSAACYFVPNDDGGWTVRGAGWGHGVGMCQTGAIGQAHAGRTAEQILTHYYTGAEVVTLYE